MGEDDRKKIMKIIDSGGRYVTATLPTTPAAWAIRLSKILQHFQDTTGESMYPIKVQEIACEVSKQFFP